MTPFIARFVVVMTSVAAVDWGGVVRREAPGAGGFSYSAPGSMIAHVGQQGDAIFSGQNPQYSKAGSAQDQALTTGNSRDNTPVVSAAAPQYGNAQGGAYQQPATQYGNAPQASGYAPRSKSTGPNYANCQVPMWKPSDYVCKEKSSIEWEDSNGHSRKEFEDDDACTVQCPGGYSWRKPDIPDMTCTKGVWETKSGSEVRGITCRTDPKVYGGVAFVVLIGAVATWAYYQKRKKDAEEHAALMAVLDEPAHDEHHEEPLQDNADAEPKPQPSA